MTSAGATMEGTAGRRAGGPGWAVLLLGAAMLVFFVAPLAYLLGLSVQTFVQPGIFSDEVTLDNYARAILDPYAFNTLVTSLRISGVTTICCVVLGLPVAMYIARSRGWRQRVALIVVCAALFTNLVVRAYGWMVVLAPNGPISGGLRALGLIDRPLRLASSETGVVIALTQELLPIFILFAAAALQAVGRSLEEAAAAAGAGPVRIFRRVIVPVALPGMSTGAILVFLMAMGAFIVPEFVGGGRVLTVSTLIRQLVARVTNYPFAAALSILLILVMIAGLVLVVLAGRRWFGRGAVGRGGAA